LALDDFEDRFATAVRLALDASRISGGDEPDASEEAQCPTPDMIASYYEDAINHGERACLETHFSQCARCQGTLAALLHAAPVVDTAPEADGFAAAAVRRAAAESAAIRERWSAFSPRWRIAGASTAAVALLTVVVVASLHRYQGRLAPEGERMAAASAAAHYRHKLHIPSSVDELALNENKSLAPAATAEPRTATPPAATSGAAGAPMRNPTRDLSSASPAASAGGAAPPSATGEAAAESSNAPVEAAIPSQTAAPLAAPPNSEQNADATAATAAQAAAALGALASTPVAAAPPASAVATAGAVASAAAAATPSAARQATAASAPALASPALPSTKVVGGAVTAPLAGAVVGGAVGAPTAAAAATTATPPASEISTQVKPAATAASEPSAQAKPAERATAAATPGTVIQEFAVLAPPPHRLERFQKQTVTPAPAKTSEIAPNGNFHKSESASEPAASAGTTELSSRAQRRARLAESKRAADIAREAERAQRDSRLQSAVGSHRPDSAAPFQLESAMGSLVPGSASALPTNSPVAPQPQHAIGAAGAAHSSIGQAHAAAPSAAPSSAGNGIPGNTIVMMERSVASAPAIAKVAPGIPVPPRSILVSPVDHSVYWSLQNSGMIYSTTDRKTWTLQPTGVQADLLAGMATSDKVCWAVGRKGTILLTTDGMHWEQVKSPTTSDVMGITAASKDVATIFTSGGVSYSTFDGGSNWEQAN
jgi:hypothetical protein